MQTLQSTFFAVLILGGGWFALEHFSANPSTQDEKTTPNDEFFLDDDVTVTIPSVRFDSWFPESSAPPALTPSAAEPHHELTSVPPSALPLPSEPKPIPRPVEADELAPIPMTRQTWDVAGLEEKTEDSLTALADKLLTKREAPTDLLTKSAPSSDPVEESRPFATSDQPVAAHVDAPKVETNIKSLVKDWSETFRAKSPDVPATTASTPAEKPPIEQPTVTRRVDRAVEETPRRWQDLTSSLSPLARSAGGREMVAAKFGTGEYRILVVGEASGRDRVAARWASELCNDLRRANTTWLSQQTVIIVPSLNPDGETTNSSENAAQVSLVKNFPASAYRPGSFTDSDPAIEPETRALMRLLDDFQPQRVVLLTSRNEPTALRVSSAAMQTFALWKDRVGVRVEPQASDSGNLFAYAGTVLGLPTVELQLEASPTDTSGLSRHRPVIGAALTRVAMTAELKARGTTGTTSNAPVSPRSPDHPEFEPLPNIPSR
jgi:hypothetical protein